ncbi:Alpha/Beta hydrolase protein [Podospora australis]|uniref:Alpha/Beta hydrolase protein n=1 Tax=Podospora australis TaxID=1536484 RepID=A0AAN6WLM3_9PEZI|nr:Alpha/Beta hydrolase protein [Podospora australis]
MRGRIILGSLLSCSFTGVTQAQFPPERDGITIIKSIFHNNVSISFKEPGICETTPGVKSYSGYVHFPPQFVDGADQNYPVNTFFWFFEARNNPKEAPLAIWINGGPGAGSIMGALEENGPCFVSPDAKSTYHNPWSWNNEVNMLYIDQPVQSGFSYDVLTNVTLRFDGTGESFDAQPIITPTNFTEGNIPSTNYTYRVGTLGSQKLENTANTTARAARAMWQFLQVWTSEFPHYNSSDKGISLWAESYGGHYGPEFFLHFQQQNERIENGTLSQPGANHLHLDTLGIVNGGVDWILVAEAAIDFPFNNTYGAQLYSKSLHDELKQNWTRPNGWKDTLQACADSLRHSPPSNETESSRLCSGLIDGILSIAGMYINETGRAMFDIAHPTTDPFPPPYMYGYLNEASVLSALGVPVNFTSQAQAVAKVFDQTFDPLRPVFTDALGYLLDAGIKVHMMYGDRDLICNWIGGEKTSLAIPWKYQKQFGEEAGYAPLTVGKYGETKGLTRQWGNLSFTRMFQAGHEVPAYQPESSYELFRRASAGLDIATGTKKVVGGGDDEEEYRTEGPGDAWGWKEKLPELPRSRCYVWKPETCASDVWKTVVDGTAMVENGFVVDENDGKEDGGDRRGGRDDL